MSGSRAKSTWASGLARLLGLALAAITLGAGCAGSGTPEASSPVVVMFAIDEVGLGAHGYVSLTNFTDGAATTRGLSLCQGTRCYALPDTSVAAGSTARIATADGAGLPDVIAMDASIGVLQPTDGEIALYAGGKIDDPSRMLAYVEWGSTPHRLTPIAIEAGLWLKGSYAPSSAKATRLYRDAKSGLWLYDQ